jgi:uncharacterized protein involved in oxidation of intracellular sulfur
MVVARAGFNSAARTLLILNDPPYGTERSYNGFRLADSLARRDAEQVRVFLMCDAVASALSGQKTPGGYYNLERTLRSTAAWGAEIACRDSCLEARGIRFNHR